MTLRRLAGWLGVVAVLELVTRVIVYALAPAPLVSARSLGHQLGGPRFALVLLVAVGLAALLSTGLVWLAAIGVRERWELAEQRPVGPAPRVALRALVLRAIALTLVGWFAFAGVESIIHLRAGLGFHGLDCLVGPVHRNALPVVAGLAIVASALIAAAQLLFAWMRRTVAAFSRARPIAAPVLESVVVLRPGRLRSVALRRGTPVRGPPVLVA